MRLVASPRLLLHAIPGQSRQWVLDHVRCGKETVVAEVQQSGFTLVDEVDVGLRENYLLRFRRP